MITRMQYDALPTEVQARIEISECVLRLRALKWWQRAKRKALMSHIELVASCHVPNTLNYFGFLDSK